MAKSFTVYWTPDGYQGFKPGDPIKQAYGTFGGRINPGDRVYVTNVRDGAARLLGAFTVAKVGPRGPGVSPPEQLYATPGSGTPFAHRPIPILIAQALRFKSKGNAGLAFRPDGSIDGQALRTFRELEPASAEALEALLAQEEMIPAVSGDTAGQQGHREVTPIYDDYGHLIDANFSVRAGKERFEVILGSRGGTKGTTMAVNTDYAQGLRLILTRLAGLRATLEDAVVESRALIARGLGEEERRVQGVSLPVGLSNGVDVQALASGLQRGQIGVGSQGSAGKGNSTRRLLLRVHVPESTAAFIEEYLASGASKNQPLALGPVASGPRSGEEDFDPQGIVDARRMVERSLALREGQPAFRKSLLDAYGRRCAITGCDVVEILEAAHIVPYWGPSTNHVQNGLLLRADLHTLFDRGLLGVEPFSGKIKLARRLNSSEYRHLDGARLRVPDQPQHHPSLDALQRHFDSITHTLAE